VLRPSDPSHMHYLIRYIYTLSGNVAPELETDNDAMMYTSLIAARGWYYTRRISEKLDRRYNRKKVLLGPIILEDIPQISCFLLVVQGEDLRDSVSYSRLALVCVALRTTGEVEGGVS